MSMFELRAILRQKLNDAIAREAGNLLDKPASLTDFADVKFRIGKIQGLKEALMLLGESTKQLGGE